MEKTISNQKRLHLKGKMIEVFEEDIEPLTRELQEILADDLVTAFQNRLKILEGFQLKHL